MVRAIFPLDFLAGSFEGFWAISSAAEREFGVKLKGLLGSRKRLEFWGVSPLLCGGSKAGGDSKRAKSPKNSSHFRESSESRVRLAETVQSTHWNKIPNPRNDSSIFPLQSIPRAIETHKSSKIPQQNQMLLPKNPRLDPRKIQ